MPSTHSVLKSIDSTSPVSWTKFIHALPDPPHAYVEKSEWKELLQTIGALEDMELITVERDRNSNQILTLALTKLGEERLKESEEADRLAIERRRTRIEADRLGLWGHVAKNPLGLTTE